MADFVLEQVNRLNDALLTRFQTQPLDTVVVTAVDTIQALEQDYSLFLTLASRDINLTSTTCLPDIELVEKYLELFSNQTCTNNELEWLFISKCTVAIYGYLLKNILNSTLPLSEAIHYWNSIYGSKRHESYYALQTLPIRITYLGINTIKKMRTTQLGLKNLLCSPEYLFLNMFPTYARVARQKTFSFLSLNYGTLFKQLIHQEIKQKIHTLDHFRIQQASRLGLMIQLSPFTLGEEKDLSIESSQCAAMMKHILHNLTHIETLSDFDVTHTLDFIESTVVGQPMDIAKGLLQVIHDWNKSIENINLLKSMHGPPSFLTRYWIPGVISYAVINHLLKVINEKQDAIQTWFNQFGMTTKEMFINWIWEPILKVLDTIQLKDERLNVLAKEEDLKGELKSLERMVSKFSHHRYSISEHQVDEIIQNVRQGDMSLILKAYENEIKHPLKSTIQGDLVQTLLIQIQKTKVDVDLAMSALDKLLKSNELNFAFLAVAPSMLIAWGGFAWLKRTWYRRSGRNIDLIISSPMRHTMRRIERLFNLSSAIGLLDCENQGILLCEVHLLRSYACHLPTRNSIRELFIEDLRDLENPKLTIKQKLETIERMTRSWSFLRPK